VTLAATHADLVAPWIAGRATPAELSAFTTARFAASKEARHV
jgi:hypothetical protein